MRSLAPNTLQTYERGLDAFNKFRVRFRLKNIWPIPLQEFAMFLAFLFNEGLAHSSIKTYICGISFFCKINCFDDPCDKFITKKLLEGIRRSKTKTKDARLPVTEDLLHLLLNVLKSICNNSFETKLFKAAFCLAFYALLRIGEIASSNGSQKHVIGISDVYFQPCGAMIVQIPSSKTDQIGLGATLKIDQHTGSSFCPCKLLIEYIEVRPKHVGPLFCHLNCQPITRYQFVSVLKKGLEHIGIDASLYSSHSFRIGSATTLSMKGVSDEIIMQLGRWKSNAYKGYIRPC